MNNDQVPTISEWGNLDKWVIFYGYDMYGTANCKNYFK